MLLYAVAQYALMKLEQDFTRESDRSRCSYCCGVPPSKNVSSNNSALRRSYYDRQNDKNRNQATTAADSLREVRQALWGYYALSGLRQCL